MILHGEGGTRKSRVLSYLTQLCESWQRVGALVLPAPTGIAAANIGGHTLHSALCLGSWKSRGGGASRSGAYKRKEDEKIQCWAPARLVAIDECFMMGNQLFYTVSSRFQLVNENPMKFGGLHVILRRDCTQLPPVVGQASYTSGKKAGVRGVTKQAGYELFKSFQHAVLIIQNVRAAVDNEWSGVLRRLRRGVSNTADLLLLRKTFWFTRAAAAAVGETGGHERRRWQQRRFCLRASPAVPCHRHQKPGTASGDMGRCSCGTSGQQGPPQPPCSRARCFHFGGVPGRTNGVYT